MKIKCHVCGNEQEDKFAYCQSRNCSAPMDEKAYKKMQVNREEEKKQRVNLYRIIASIGCLIFSSSFITNVVVFELQDKQSMEALQHPLFSLLLLVSFILVIYGAILLIKRAKIVAIATIATSALIPLSSISLLSSFDVFLAIEGILVLALLILSYISGYLLFKWYQEEKPSH